MTAIADAIQSLPWEDLEQQLWQDGYARTTPLLTAAQCAELAALYAEPQHFRSRIDMARFRFGIGDYQYFAAPLPPFVAEVRASAYPYLSAIANRWSEALNLPERYPAVLSEFTAACHAAGQTKPTPLLLHYTAGGYNCLHQDLYGAIAFPLQMLVLLGQPGRDYAGGEFLLVEQQLRGQSIPRVIHAHQGEAIFFTTRHRPAKSTRGYYRANVRHGVSRVESGTRYTLGIIFHDAE